MIETRFALPQRSPQPFIVPCTCVAPASTAASELATPQLGVVVAVDADPHARRRSAGHRVGRRLGRPGAAARSRWCRTATTRVGARLGGGAQARAARSRGRRGSRRRSARRRRSRACPAPTRKATDSAIMRRFSSRSTRTTFSRCSPQVLPTSVQTGAKQSASTRSAGVLLGRGVAPAGHAEGGDLGVGEALAARAARTARAPSGSRTGSRPRSTCDAELVELVRDAQLLGGRQRHALALHAVAQGGVVELDREVAVVIGDRSFLGGRRRTRAAAGTRWARLAAAR